MRNLLIIADSKWAPSPRCPPVTERRGPRLCYASDYSLYPWVISNLRNMLSKQGHIKCSATMNITEFLLEEEANGNRNPPTLPFSHPGRKGIIIQFLCHYQHPPFVLLRLWTERLNIKSTGVLPRTAFYLKSWCRLISVPDFLCHARWC